MHTIRTLDGSIDDTLDPKFRTINFAEDGPQITVATHLRYAWTALPPECAEEPSRPFYGALGDWIATNARRSEAELQSVPQNPDRDEIYTAWRDEIYRFWNHVFFDVGKFLSEVNCTADRFRPPNHDVFALRYFGGSHSNEDGSETTEEVFTKRWDTNVMLIPAHLEPGVRVRMTTLEADGEFNAVEMTRGTFSAETPGDIWCLRRNVEAKFYIEGGTKDGSQGVAAVTVVGFLTLNEDRNP